MILCFLDTETTGLDPETSEILEIAIIRREADGTERTFHTRVKPTPEGLEKAHPKALSINGYAAQPELWEAAPGLTDVANEIADFLEGGFLVGHNVAFDERMLNANFSRFGIKRRIPYHKIDTITLAYEHLTPLGLERCSLDSVREFLGWSGDGAHTALVDAQDSMRLFDLLWRMTEGEQLMLKLQLRELRG
jgi:DNA polymerase III epsilon subunit-like protein